MSREVRLKELQTQLEIESTRIKSILELELRPIVSMVEMSISNFFRDFSENDIEQALYSSTTNQQVRNTEDIYESLLRSVREQEKSNVDLFVSYKSFGRGYGFSEAISNNSQDKHEIYTGISWRFDLEKNKSSNEIGKFVSQKRQAELRSRQISSRLKNVFAEFKSRIISNSDQVYLLEKMIKQQAKILEVERTRFLNGKIYPLIF